MNDRIRDHLRGSSWVVSLFVLLHVVSVGTLRGTQERTEPAVRTFGDLCESHRNTVNDEPFVEARFAPIRPLDDNEPPQEGTWLYAYITERYPDDRFRLGEVDDRIHLVSTMRAPLLDSLPPYLWHVISVPTPRQAIENGGSFIARYEEFRRGESDAWVREEYRDLRESVVSTEAGTFLFYLKRSLSEADKASITRLWQQTFGDAAMEDLVEDTFYSPSGSYTHTFIYQDVPRAASEINLDTGDRRNSSKIALAPGTAFGFVLDHDGNCLASTTLTLVPND